VLSEDNVKGIIDFGRNRVPKAIGLGMGGVANEDAGSGVSVDFGKGGCVKRESAAADLTQVRQRGGTAIPEFVWCATIISSGGCQTCEICSS
jgi:hypothetical protein